MVPCHEILARARSRRHQVVSGPDHAPAWKKVRGRRDARRPLPHPQNPVADWRRDLLTRVHTAVKVPRTTKAPWCMCLTRHAASAWRKACCLTSRQVHRRAELTTTRSVCSTPTKADADVAAGRPARMPHHGWSRYTRQCPSSWSPPVQEFDLTGLPNYRLGPVLSDLGSGCFADSEDEVVGHRGRA
jgi:hypothetical protein